MTITFCFVSVAFLCEFLPNILQHVNSYFVQGNGGPFCEFKVRVLDDHSVNLESAKFRNQMIAIQESGRLGDPRSHDNDLAKEFFAYCKVMK